MKPIMNPQDVLHRTQTLQQEGRLAEAEILLKQLLRARPELDAAWHALGLLAYAAGNLPLAAELLAQAIALRGDVGLYQRNMGEILRRMGRLDEAVAAGRRATALMPADVDAQYNLGLALADQSQWAAAIAAYRQALALDPAHGLSWNNLGAALEKSGDRREAESAYARAVQRNPAHFEAQNNLGVLLLEQGKLEAAAECFNAAIAADPDFIEAHFNLSQAKTYTENDPQLQFLESRQASMSAMPAKTRIRYLFALGKGREDVGRYDGAFAAYAEGNRLKHALRPYDETKANTLHDDLMRVFDRQIFERHARSRPDGGVHDQTRKTPVFIVGMPRSGTSLLEQILSSHPDIHGGGELTDLNDVIMAAAPDGAFPERVAGLGAHDLARLGDAYMKRLEALSGDSLCIIDKMPANYLLIGMIRLMLPDARIIHAMRDPMDSCFSNYARLFSDDMDFAYDLGTLGRYYIRYITLMEHWHAVLPAGYVLDLRYEELVADTAQQTRRLLDFLGLPWHEGCLQFHQNQRSVRTASLAQVRQPIYRTSIARWKHFASHLQPLLNIVANYRETEP